jgi:2-polyprenyl-6-methoxyphenol 4-hydroxylase
MNNHDDATIQPNKDIAIIGGGMAGASLALLLAQHLPDYRIFLIEKNSLQTAPLEQLSLPSFDARSTALSCSTRDILQSINVWNVLAPFAEPILSVHVSERHRAPGMLMRASDIAKPSLGYVIENRQLGQHLLHAIQQHPRITCLDNTVIERITFTTDAALLSTKPTSPSDVTSDSIDDTELTVTLAVIADGSQSRLRQQLGIASDEVPYDQNAIIANIVTEHAHNGVAYERFTDTGPMALLPLTTVNNEHRSALIWTLPTADANAVVALNDNEFLARVTEKLGGRCGQLLAVGVRHTYPLALLQAREQIRSRIVLLGNAAHSLHPVAGQGFNLIVRDCQALADTLAQAAQQQHDIGVLAVLQQYLQKQQWDQQKTITASDWLPRLFTSRNTAQKVLRTAALLGLDFLPGLRERFTREATGL